MFGQKYSLLAIVSVECTVSIVRQLAKGVSINFSPVTFPGYGHRQNYRIFSHCCSEKINKDRNLQFLRVLDECILSDNH